MILNNNITTTAFCPKPQTQLASYTLHTIALYLKKVFILKKKNWQYIRSIISSECRIFKQFYYYRHNLLGYLVTWNLIKVNNIYKYSFFYRTCIQIEV